MNNQITLTDEQMAALSKGESITLSPPPAEEWQPEGGEFQITGAGWVAESSLSGREFGMRRTTRAMAERAKDEMRIHHRLLAWRDEYCPDYRLDWKQMALTVQFDHNHKKWVGAKANARETPGAVYFPLSIIDTLVDKLNSGLLKL